MTFGNTKVAGTLLLVGGVQFVIALIIAEAVYPGYSISGNFISDLGVWGKPSAPVFNSSAMLLGSTVLAAAYFINRHFKNRVITVMFALAGAGALGVGIFPENTFVVNGIPVIHYISAFLGFIVGGFAAIATYKITKPPFRYLSVILGVAALTAAVLFVTTRGIGLLGLSIGGMERMMAYPTILWIISLGGYLLGTASEK
jgi:hypothetical membrane protein